MATQVQRRRGNTAQNNAFLGALGELAFNTELIGLRLHDGVTVGGHRVAMFSDIVSPPFADTTNVVMGSVDPTKLLRFEVDGFTAATTRTLTPQNANYTIAGTDVANNFSVNQIFGGQILLANGTSSLPAYAFSGDSSFGIYKIGNSLSFAWAGVDLVVFANGIIDIRSNVGALRLGTAQDLRIVRSASGVMLLDNGAGSFTRLQFGGTTSSFPSLRRTATALECRLADDSAFAPFAANIFQTMTALVALGGGATPTFGTIGGTGPATAAQNTWLRMLDSTGAAFWVPAWK